MTADFAEDFCDACAKEGEPYLIAYRTGGNGWRVRWSNEDLNNKEIIPEKEFVEMIKFTILNE